MRRHPAGLSGADFGLVASTAVAEASAAVAEAFTAVAEAGSTGAGTVERCRV